MVTSSSYNDNILAPLQAVALAYPLYPYPAGDIIGLAKSHLESIPHKIIPNHMNTVTTIALYSNPPLLKGWPHSSTIQFTIVHNLRRVSILEGVINK